MQIVDADPPPPAGPRIIPALVGEPLDVVRHVAGQVDDRRAQAGFGLDSGFRKSRFDEAGKEIGGIFSSRITGPAL